MTGTIDYCVIRHKVTGELMPQTKRSRGYSHWNPSTGSKTTEDIGIPRILKNRIQARRVIAQWNATPNGKRSVKQSGYYGEDWDDIVDIKPDGRKKEDLEIVPIVLVLQEPVK